MREMFRPPRRALLSLALSALAACGSGTGGRCTTSAECQTGLLCVETSSGALDGGTASSTRYCMSACDRLRDGGGGLEHLCNNGLVCLALESQNVCFVGGSHPFGEPCTSSLECEAGTVCAPDSLRCEQACTPGDDRPCRDGETCIDVGSGVCRPSVVVAPDSSTTDGGASL